MSDRVLCGALSAAQLRRAVGGAFERLSQTIASKWNGLDCVSKGTVVKDGASTTAALVSAGLTVLIAGRKNLAVGLGGGAIAAGIVKGIVSDGVFIAYNESCKNKQK